MSWITQIVETLSFEEPSNAEENILLYSEFWREATVSNLTNAINRGADIHAYDKNRWTPLHFAAAYGAMPERLDLLLDMGVDIELRTKKGETPLHIAVMYCGGWVNKVRFLLSKGANIEACTDNKSTPLHIAAMYSDTVGIVGTLLSKGANFNAQDIYGKTPDHYAAKNLSTARFAMGDEICKARLRYKASMGDIEDEYKYKLLDLEFLEFATFEDIAEAISYGADINARGWKDMTPLHQALLRDNEWPVETAYTY